MNFEQLVYIVEIAKFSTLSIAAQNLHVTHNQPVHYQLGKKLCSIIFLGLDIQPTT